MATRSYSIAQGRINRRTGPGRAKPESDEDQCVIIALSRVPRLIEREYPLLPAKLKGLAGVEGTHFIDCSRIFDGEPHTTVADIWHFSDPGHELLAEALAEGLVPVLEARKRRGKPPRP
jgi:hypothetical protein